MHLWFQFCFWYLLQNIHIFHFPLSTIFVFVIFCYHHQISKLERSLDLFYSPLILNLIQASLSSPQCLHFFSFHNSGVCHHSLSSNASDFQASSSILKSLLVSSPKYLLFFILFVQQFLSLSNFCHLLLSSNNKTGVIFKLVLFLFNFKLGWCLLHFRLSSCLTFFIFIFGLSGLSSGLFYLSFISTFPFQLCFYYSLASWCSLLSLFPVVFSQFSTHIPFQPCFYYSLLYIFNSSVSFSIFFLILSACFFILR